MLNNIAEDTIVRIFRENILTPILYMYEEEGIIKLVGFYDKNIKVDEILKVSNNISNAINRKITIVDIREYSESDRIDIISNSKVLYSEDELMEKLFVSSMIEDYKKMIKQRESAITRYGENHSPYLQ